MSVKLAGFSAAMSKVPQSASPTSSGGTGCRRNSVTRSVMSVILLRYFPGSESCGKLREPHRRDVDQKCLKLSVEPGQDQKSDSNQQDAEDGLPALTCSQQPFFPSQHHVPRNEAQEEQRQRRAQAEGDHNDCALREALTLPAEDRGGTERRTDAGAPDGAKQQSDCELPFQPGYRKAAEATVRPGARRTSCDRQLNL